MEKELLYNFNFREIQKHVDGITRIEDKLQYLYEFQHVIELIEIEKELLEVNGLNWITANEYIDYYMTNFKLNNPTVHPDNFYDQSYKGLQNISYVLSKEIKSLIDYYTNTENIATLAENNFPKIFTTLDRHALIRILSTLMDCKIISSKTEIKQLGNLFDSDEINKFVNNFSKIETGIDKTGQKTMNEQLLNFIVTLTKNSFRENEILKIVKQLETP